MDGRRTDECIVYKPNFERLVYPVLKVASFRIVYVQLEITCVQREH